MKVRLLVLVVTTLVAGSPRPSRGQAPVGDLKTWRTPEQLGLALNGTGVYRRFFFRIYELSLYLPRPCADAPRILASEEPKYVRMRFLRDLKRHQLADGFLDAYALNCADQCEALKPHMNRLVDLMPDVAEGVEIEFAFHPAKVSMRIAGRGSADIESGDFGRVLLRTWIGEHAPSRSLRNGMVGDGACLPPPPPASSLVPTLKKGGRP